MSKILWINDLSVQMHPGGAQRTINLFMEHGKRLGHKVFGFYHDSDPTLLYEKYDYIVSSNIIMLHQKIPNLIEFLASLNNHIRYECDSNEYLSLERRQLLYNNTRLAIFLSELHRDLFLKVYKIQPNDIEIIYPPIGPEFHNFNQKREEAILWTGLFHPLKGIQKLIDYIKKYPEKKYVFTGFNIPQTTDTNIVSLEYVKYQDMPKIYNKYTEFFFHPTGVHPLYIEPFSRTYAEAAFCGMKMNTSKNLGALLEIEKYGLEIIKERCNNAKNFLWKRMSNL
jgi:glycosyltransferase involved in cell wall biosynthesis